ncbi:MAG: signal peptidase II [Phycisphaerales bacterium]|nr:signal peptidase II [Phycisphaerales bacterium]MCB9835686.1 signal peptidase II [Phycisphaera sp.]
MSQTAPTTTALQSPRAWAVLLVVLVLGLAADLASKSIAFRTIADHPVSVTREEVLASADTNRELIPRHRPVTVLPKVLDFTLVLNQGAVFGMGAGKRWLFIVFTVGAIGLGLWMFGAWTRPKDWIAHVSLGLLLSGGLGNLYDRLMYACVRDFIHPLPAVTIGSWEVWPYVSNVADALLIIGIIGLMWHLWRADQPRRVSESDVTGDQSASD